MKAKLQLALVFALGLVVPQIVQAQETSRVIPFNGVATNIAPGSTGQALTLQLWDAASGGNLVFNEAQTLDVDANGAISFNLGAATSGGLNPNNFPSGSSRFLDVLDNTSASVLPNGRIPLNATPFALSPGPQGPPGPAGPPGPPGAGSLTSVAASAGLTANPNPITTSGSLSLDTAFTNARYAQLAAANTFTGLENVFTGDLRVGNFLSAGANISARGAIIANGASIAGNGTAVLIGDAGCGPPTAAIGIGALSGCANFALGANPNSRETVINRPTGGPISFREGNGPDQMRIAPGGNVGIGTTSPAAKLHVAGNVRTDGNVSIGTGMNNNGGGFKHLRRAGLSIQPNARLAFAFLWGTSFADTNYTVTATVSDESITNGAQVGVHLELVWGIRADRLNVTVFNNDTISAHTFTIHLIAVHD